MTRLGLLPGAARIEKLGILLVLLLGIAPLSAPGASAHTQSYGFLSVSAGDEALEGRVELAVRDLDTAFDLDADRDGKITWGEFRIREAELEAAVLGQISIGAPGASCALTGQPALTDSRGGETYLIIPFTGVCPFEIGQIEIGYNLLFDVDAQHRGLVAVTHSGQTRSFVMTPETRRISLDQGDSPSSFGLFFTFIAHGAHHIWIGYDHILFLITLLLGTVVSRQSGRWVPVDNLKTALVAATKVVTAFTLAHSLTLGLAAFGVLRLPSALTESVIAATIVLAAINNVTPLVSRKIWLVAFVFGLIHGVGFANVLADLDLPRDGLLTALLAFNLGVEFGQLAIVIAVLPILVIAGRRPTYGRVALPAASFAIALIGGLWLIERTAGITILPIG